MKNNSNNNKNKENSNNGFVKSLVLGASLLATGGIILYDSIKKSDQKEQKKNEEEIILKNINENNIENQNKKISKDLEKLINNSKKNDENNLILPSISYIDETNENLFKCPISDKIITDPVITPNNITYEKKSLLDYIEKNKCDPKTKKKLNKEDVVPNYILMPHIYENQNNIKSK